MATMATMGRYGGEGPGGGRAEPLAHRLNPERLAGPPQAPIAHLEPGGPSTLAYVGEQPGAVRQQVPEERLEVPGLLVVVLDAHEVVRAVDRLPEPRNPGRDPEAPGPILNRERQRRGLGSEVHLRNREHAAVFIVGIASDQEPCPGRADEGNGAAPAIERAAHPRLVEMSHHDDRRAGRRGEPRERGQ